jgi:hypothetical protein
MDFVTTTLVIMSAAAIGLLVFLAVAYTDTEAQRKRRMAEDRQRAYMRDVEEARKIAAEARQRGWK